jgi:eukaryotic-like serine/threonine-protein kinase
VENVVKLKNKKTVGKVALLITAVLAVGILGISCISGMTAIGWSGGTVSNGTLYVGSIAGRLAAVNLTDNSRQWAEPLKAVVTSGLFGCAPSSGGGCAGGTSVVPIYGTPVVSDNLVYIAGYNGKIFAYNTNNLATRWVFPREGNLQPLVGSLVLARNKLFIGCSDGWVYALDAATGDMLAEFKTGDKIWGTPAVDGNTLYIGSFDKNLYALNTNDLSLKWKFTTEGSIIATPLVYNGTVYIGSFDRNLYAVNASDGALKWKYTANNWFWAQPAVINDTIYAGCLDGFIYALKADTGAKIKEFDLLNPVASQPVVVNDLIIFASQNGVIYKIDSGSQEITQIAALKFNVDGPLTAYEGIIYIQTQDFNMQRVDPVNGSLLTPIPLVS